ncbi:MAG: roadblock/LC7 domain-containing protein [Methanomassiliicoccus sp.]|nr:roadblock/LC7 domain-containing protein [Methanomassiliicoccus sp.]
MSELSPVRSALDQIKGQDHVLDASLVSRGGMYIMGGPLKGIHRETFAAMSAIILGAAETTSTELKDKLTKISIDLTEQSLVIVGIGTKYLVTVLMDQNGDKDKVVALTRELLANAESIL